MVATTILDTKGYATKPYLVVRKDVLAILVRFWQSAVKLRWALQLERNEPGSKLVAGPTMIT